MLQLQHPIVVVGAGPIGLTALAHLVTRGMDALLLEAGDDIATHVRDWAHVRLFSPWRLNLDPVVTTLLEASGWVAPVPDELPTGGDLVERGLRPLAALPEIQPRLRFHHRVMAISRYGLDKVTTRERDNTPFVLRVHTPSGEVEILARAVLDASGVWGTPNPAGCNGLSAWGEPDNADRIAYGIPDILGIDRDRYAGRRVLVVGAGHSAANNVLNLVDLAEDDPTGRIVWATRSGRLSRVFGGGVADGLPARGDLGQRLRELTERGAVELITGFRVARIDRDGAHLMVESLDRQRIGPIDRIIVATGQRPDLAPLRELRLSLDPWLESCAALGPLIDPNLHSCGSVRPHGVRELSHPDAGFYTVGVKSYGRAPTFLMATGYEQVRSVVAHLAGDLVAAHDTRLVLPETGVCGVEGIIGGEAGGCCGGPALEEENACCVADVVAKEAGLGGCGCGSGPATPTLANQCCTA